jgi:hypothetical protein
MVVSLIVVSGFQPVGRPDESRAVAYSSFADHVLEPRLRKLMLISRNFSG